MAMGESDAAPKTSDLGTDSSPRIPRSLLRREEVVQDSGGIPPSQLEEENKLVAISTLISCTPEM